MAIFYKAPKVIKKNSESVLVINCYLGLITVSKLIRKSIEKMITKIQVTSTLVKKDEDIPTNSTLLLTIKKAFKLTEFWSEVKIK